jgi:hypothetical protein
MPAPLPALPGHRGDQPGRHCPLLCSGQHPLHRLHRLFSERGLLPRTAASWNGSAPTLADPWVLADPQGGEKLGDEGEEGESLVLQGEYSPFSNLDRISLHVLLFSSLSLSVFTGWPVNVCDGRASDGRCM